jgi:hypothetical protein
MELLVPQRVMAKVFGFGLELALPALPRLKIPLRRLRSRLAWILLSPPE